jgi:hypothetical protein
MGGPKYPKNPILSIFLVPVRKTLKFEFFISMLYRLGKACFFTPGGPKWGFWGILGVKKGSKKGPKWGGVEGGVFLHVVFGHLFLGVVSGGNVEKGQGHFFFSI